MEPAFDKAFRLWLLYLHIQNWGTPEYKRLDKRDRDDFAAIVKSGGLFDAVEQAKEELANVWPEVPDVWLYPVFNSEALRRGPLERQARNDLLKITSVMMPKLVKLKAKCPPAREPRRHGGRQPETERNKRWLEDFEDGGFKNVPEFMRAKGIKGDPSNVRKALKKARESGN